MKEHWLSIVLALVGVVLCWLGIYQTIRGKRNQSP